MNCQQCGKESKWVDNGPRLQYYYCTDCKIEVQDNIDTPQDDRYGGDWLFYHNPVTMKVDASGMITWETDGGN